MVYCLYFILNFLVLGSIESTPVSISGEIESTIAEYGSLPVALQNDIFQRVFGDSSVLISFLNAAFASHKHLKETTITSLKSRERKIRIGQGQTIFDIRATDSVGKHYFIEMQRAFGPHQIIRYQHNAAQAFCEAFDETCAEFKEKHKKAPDGKELDRLVPKVILIVLTDKETGKSLAPVLSNIIKAQKKKRNQKEGEPDSPFSFCVSLEKFASSSKMNFLFIDLDRFDVQAPNSSFHKWIHFLKSTKNGHIEKSQESMYADESSIVKALQIFKEETRQKDFIIKRNLCVEEKYVAEHEFKEKVAERLLDRGETVEEIAKLTELSVKDVEDLRKKIHKSHIAKQNEES